MKSSFSSILSLLLLFVSPLAGQTTVKVCVPYEVDDAYLTNCTAMLQPVIGAMGTVDFQCVLGGSSIKCMEMIRDEEADISAFDGGDVFTAYQLFGHIPLAAEQYSTELNGSYYAVAVVDKDSCPLELSDLKGKNACHTGYRKTAGWFMPFGTLYSEGLLDSSAATAEDVNDDAELMADFFDGMCVPRTSSGPAFDASGEPTYYDPLCSICASGDCTTDSDYYDYSGAFRCLSEGVGDVAFIKHSTVLDYASDGAKPADWATRPSTDFQLLCRNGGCADVTDFKTCNLANVPAHAIVGRSSYGSDGEDRQMGVNIVATLLDLVFFPEWRDRVTELGGQANFFLKSGTIDLVDVRAEFDTYMTPQAFANYKAVDLITSSDKQGRFCNKNDGEMAKCQEVVANLNDMELGIQFGCVQKDGDDECLAAILSGDAEMKTFDVGDLAEGYELGLDVLVAENYGGDSGVEYYAIAVINSEDADTITQLSDLKGKRSCHTGYRKTAGWYMPVGALLRLGNMEAVNSEDLVQNDAESVAGFFSQVCAPRVTSSGPAFDSTGEAISWDELCTGCGGDCSTEDPYYNYPGALRCLMEDAGDVAFIKHTTIPQYALDGTGPESWATKSSSDFKLLCPSGGSADIDDFVDCSLAKVPAHAVLIPSGLAYKDELQQALVKASQDPIFRNQVFGSNNPDDYIFKSSTVKLDPVMVDLQTYLGEAFESLESVEAVSK
eukprot:TRINITY_DN602_c0_g2_i1.p1 TRINITY_DN602_c0_g2~~TRINITY_DN602_c0_g2_i1.p1  ORF type:complete len:722 (+),score=149.30 TRINITY_DN602_c0_g2_i1:47-2212(+)